MPTPLRVLLISNDGSDAVSTELARGGYEAYFEPISTAAELIDALSSNWDLAISDFVVGEVGAIAALNIIQEKGVDLPLIAVTGKVKDSDVLSVLKAGAADHLTRSNLMRLNAAVERELRA